MDQPTNIQITIKGTENDVKKAVLAAARRIDRDTNGFEEELYVYSEETDFKEQLDEIFDIFGNYEFEEVSENLFEFSSEQESYACTEESDIKDIANEIINVSPDVEFNITAVITITFANGYDLCVDVVYRQKELTVNSEEDYYEGFDDEDDEDFDDEDDE